ncbi:asparagine--tRNA ligase, cytoplasmic 1-like [Panicum miliaceum]|uniref:Asparagine--tRNA ligase, cytoplasmic 1-like n=1 Tax=Panicum miliaceum TaxID=4540 RepID=A0A3L6SVZ8_PANMI|nr:asparagine--tRNA ligase, cytoplasmic 1-like [Panicum miliaceum]
MASSPPSSASASSSEDATTTSSNGSAPVQFSKYSRRASARSVVGRPDGGLGLAGKRAVVGGWVKSANVVKAKRGGCAMLPPRMTATESETTGLTCTEVLMARVPLIRCIAKLIGGASAVDKASSSVSYKLAPVTALARINDGSCVPDLQIVVDSSLCPLEQVTAIGACVLVEGKIELVEGRSQPHVIELRVDKVLHIGAVDIDKYPLPNVELPPDELIKDYGPQLATTRTTAMASVARVRSEMVHAAHAFFQTNGFFHVNTPIITTTTVAGERRKMFRVMRPTSSKSDNRAITPEVVRASIKAKTKQIQALKRSDSNKEALEAAELDLQRASELAQQLEQQGSADFSDKSFQHPLYLSSDHTLHLETYACALSSVYTFSPAFQAESLETHNHLAERWTIDAELAFAELEDAISCAVDCLMWLLSTVFKNCSDELKFLSTEENNGKFFHVNSALSSPWERITYNEAVNTLLQVKDKSFEGKVELGMPLSLEHMRFAFHGKSIGSYLVDDYYKKPVIIYEYPKQLKPFYARLTEDETKVSAFDIVVPKVGIVACGTQKEERMDKLTARIDDLRLPRDHLEWYLDIRRHGTVKHSGFSMDIEQLILLVTGLNK